MTDDTARADLIARVCAEPGCGLPKELHGAPPGEPPNPTRSSHRFHAAPDPDLTTPRAPVTTEPFAAAQVEQWRAQMTERTVDPDLPWPDKDVMELVGRFLATLDAARAATPDPSGLRDRIEATDVYVAAFSDRLRYHGGISDGVTHAHNVCLLLDLLDEVTRP